MSPSPATPDERPPVAIGHVVLGVTKLDETYDYLVKLGCRPIEKGSGGVLELRGGTHLVLLPSAEPAPEGAKAPFDLMVDDIEAAKERYAALGARPSEIETRAFHRSFTVVAPSGHEITVNSSHASGRPV